MISLDISILHLSQHQVLDKAKNINKLPVYKQTKTILILQAVSHVADSILISPTER